MCSEVTHSQVRERNTDQPCLSSAGNDRPAVDASGAAAGSRHSAATLTA